MYQGHQNSIDDERCCERWRKSYV